MKIITNSEQQTINFGKKLAIQLKGGDILLLQGQLGSGKTTLVKGLAAGLGVKNEITSPTFTLMNIYQNQQTKIQLVHIDTYSIKNEQELAAIGIEDYLGDKQSICLIEWPQNLNKLLTNKKTTLVKIKSLNKDKREIQIKQN